MDKNRKDMEDVKFVEESEEAVATDVDRAREEKALVRKIDIRLLPCIWIMYLLSYMDVRLPFLSNTLFSIADRRTQRTNIGNAKVAGMTDDLNMSSDEYSISLIVFFITVRSFANGHQLLSSSLTPSPVCHLRSA